jgi:cell division topological specificity factor
MDLFKWFKKSPSSKDIAKSRLQFVLVQDRMNCSPEILEMLKTDILKVIMNYVEIDEKLMEIQISPPTEGGSVSVPVLLANIPIKNLRKVPRKSD